MKRFKLFAYLILITLLTIATVFAMKSCDSDSVSKYEESGFSDNSDKSDNLIQNAIDKINALFYNKELIKKAEAHEDFSETEFFKASALNIANMRGFLRSSIPEAEIQKQIAKDIFEAIKDLEEYFEKQAGQTEPASEDSEDNALKTLRQNSCEKFNSALINMQDEINRVNSNKFK